MEQISIMSAIKQVCAEKGLSVESVLDTINVALAAAYRKDFGNKLQNIKVEFNPETGVSKVCDVKTVVEDLPKEDELDVDSDDSEVKTENKYKNRDSEDYEDKVKFNPKTDIEISKAKEIKKGVKIGDEIVTKLDVPSDYGRMAAQTAKQVIIQKLREAERVNIFEEYKEKEGSMVSGVIQRRDMNKVLIDLGKIAAVLPREEQIRTERYNPGDTIKVLIKEVKPGVRGTEIIVSRTDSGIIRELFALEIPEIDSGSVVIKGIAREAGFRSKIAVVAKEENIDPIGSCVGQRGSRIQTIIGELGGEKIDIIEYDEDPGVFIANALSPAKVIGIEVKEKNKTAIVTVKEDQFSLAIGKEGQNVRLAAKLTGWKINIIGDGGSSMVLNSDIAKDDSEIKEKEEEK